MSNPSRPLGSSCTLGVARLRSVKFALVRTRRKGGGACELSSAELPFIRPFASSASTLRFRGSACISDERVCISWWTYIFPDRVRAIDQYALLSRSLSEPLQSIEIVKRRTFWSTCRSRLRSLIALSRSDSWNWVSKRFRVSWIILIGVSFSEM